MNGFALVCVGRREWVADAKSALYLAHELLASKGAVLVYEARAKNNVFAADGAKPVFKADFSGISVDKLS